MDAETGGRRGGRPAGQAVLVPEVPVPDVPVRAGLMQAGLVPALLVLALGSGLPGCVSASVEQLQTRPAATVSSQNRIVFIGRRHGAEYQTDREFTTCVRDAIAGDAEVSVVDEETFVDAMFPWFEPRTAPMNAQDLATMLADRAVAERLAQTRIRYLVWLDGVTRPGEDGGGMACTVGPGGGGCLGLLWWEKNAAFEAAVWDVADLESMGKVTIDASGTSYVPAVIVPVPLIARTQATACDELATQLREFFTPEPS